MFHIVDQAFAQHQSTCTVCIEGTASCERGLELVARVSRKNRAIQENAQHVASRAVGYVLATPMEIKELASD